MIVCAADDGRERHAAGNPLAAANQVRRHAVVLEAPELARAAEAGLHLVEDQEGLVAVAPGAELLDVLRRGEAGVAPLIGLGHHAGDRFRLDPLGLQGLEGSRRNVVSGPRKPSGKGTWTKSSSRLTIHP